MSASPTLPAEARRRLGKLLPLLGSEIDGEALAAARAIGRVLRWAGCDWHDLAPIVEPPEWEAAVEARPGRTSAAPSDASRSDGPLKPTKEHRPSFRDFTAREARETIVDILRRPDLTRPELELLTMLGDRLYQAPHEGLTTAEVRAVNRIWRRVEADTAGMAT